MKFNRQEFLTLLYLLLTLAITLNKTPFSLFSFSSVFIIITVFILLFFLSSPKKTTNLSFLFIVLIVSIILCLFNAGGIYEDNFLLTDITKVCYGFSLILVLLFIFNTADRKSSKLFYFIFILAFIIRFTIPFNTPNPAIDVFYILKEAPMAFLHGINPYQINYTQVYPMFKANYFAYWPGAFLIMIPWIKLFNDPRSLIIFAEFCSAILIVYLGKKSQAAKLIALIFLYNPKSLFLIEQSYLNPVNTFLIILLLYLFLKKKYLLMGVLAALLFSIQFYLGLVGFYLIKATNFSKRFLITFITISIGLILPFYFWSPKDFIYDSIGTWVIRPPVVPIPFFDSLNLNGLFLHLFNNNIPLIISGLIILIFNLFLFKKLKRFNLNNYLLTITLSVYVIFLLGTQAFANYYYFLGNLILILTVV